MKPEYIKQATTLFAGLGIQVTAGGHRHLGAVIGSVAFRDGFVKKHVNEWIVEVSVRSCPNTASCCYSAFVHGLTSRWSYIMRIIPNISHLLTHLKDVIHQEFIPSLSGRPANSNVESKIFALPARVGSLGLINPVTCSDRFFQSSTRLTTTLVNLIVPQQLSGGPNLETTLSTRNALCLQYG